MYASIFFMSTVDLLQSNSLQYFIKKTRNNVKYIAKNTIIGDYFQYLNDENSWTFLFVFVLVFFV